LGKKKRVGDHNQNGQQIQERKQSPPSNINGGGERKTNGEREGERYPKNTFRKKACTETLHQELGSFEPYFKRRRQ